MITIVITGASGFIGQHLRRAFAADGVKVRTIGRSSGEARWGQDLRPDLDDTDALINLAGRSVSCRYSKRNADAMFASRTETTKALGSRFHRVAT
jgi:NAD dependent epimerase/dehydratase family enzyme